MNKPLILPLPISDLSDEEVTIAELLKQQAEQGNPFFVQVSYYAVLTPILAKDGTVQQYAKTSSRQHLNIRSDVPAIGYDFLPTIAEWVSAQQQLPGNVDGGSLADVLSQEGQGTVKRGTESLVWYYGAYRNHKYVTPQGAIRRGPHKLIWEIESDAARLFDLSLDLGETTDLARFRPEIAREMKQELKAYLTKVGTKLPTRNVNYNPTKDAGLRRRGGF